MWELCGLVDVLIEVGRANVEVKSLSILYNNCAWSRRKHAANRVVAAYLMQDQLLLLEVYLDILSTTWER